MNRELEEYLQQRYARSTAKLYSRDIAAYLQNHSKASAAVYKDIIEYLGALRKRYSNAKTLHRMLSSMKVYYDFLIHTGKRKDNPARSVRLRDKQSRDIQLQDLFTEKELESLLERQERFGLLALRNKVLISLLIYQGLLPTEMQRLSAADIYLEAGTVYIRGGSKTTGRELPLKPAQIMLLHAYLTEVRIKLNKKPQEERLLLGVRGAPMKAEDITKHVQRSFRNKFKARKVTVMTIRQSVITNLLKAGNDLRIVQVFAGHKYASTTERYKQTSVESLKAAIDKYHPIR